MRISDWSSDVCSSDLPGVVDAQITSELERHAEVEPAPRIDVRDEPVLGVVAEMLALLRLGQVDDRGRQLKVVEQIIRRIEIDLLVRVRIDVQTRRQTAHDLAATIDRKSTRLNSSH